MKKLQFGTNEHSYVGKRLSAYIDRALPERERARVQAHLESCVSCREELESLLWTKRLLRETPTIAVPRAFVVRRADLERRHSVKRLLVTPQRRTLWATQWATALVALLFIFVLAGDMLTGGSLMPMAHKAPDEAVTAGAAPEVMLVREHNAAEQEVMPSGTDTEDDGERADEKAFKAVESESATNVPSPDAAWVMTPEGEPGGTGAVVDVQATTSITSTEEAMPVAAAMTPTLETDLSEKQAIGSPEVVQGEPPSEGTLLPEVAMPPEETPLPQETAFQTRVSSQTWSPRTIWRVVEVGLGIVLTGLIVTLIVIRKRA